MNKPRIKLRYILVWAKDQAKRKKLFKSLFITGNAWGTFHLSSHQRQSDGKIKVTYLTKESAIKAAIAMNNKYGKEKGHYSYYKCLFCEGYHVGKTRKMETEILK